MAILNEFGQPYTFAHAADRSNRRGPQHQVRNDDIDKLIPSHDRRTLCSLSNRLFMNMGVPRACILQKADFATGEAWIPSYIGPDADAGKAISKFMADVWYPQCDTRGGIFDWWKMLELSSVSIDRDGEIFWLMVKGDDGFPRIQLIPSHRCYSAHSSDGIVGEEGPFKGYRINDGIIYYRSGRPAAYRFNVGAMGQPVFKDVPAAEVIHLFDPTHCEQGRGLPAFTHALESLKMSLFSTEDERIRQQIISRLHLTIFNDSGGPDLDDPINGLTGDVSLESGFSSKAFPGGVMYLPAEGNQRIEQIKHDNPGPIWDAFQDRIVRDAVISVWSYSVWKGSGQGTAERGEILKCRRFITKRQGQLWYAAKRAFTWAYSIFAASGRFAPLSNPTAWTFSYPPRLTVDDGRESKMELDELRTGARNISEVLGARGLTKDEFFKERAISVWERKYIAQTVAEEMNAKHGVEITIEDREMFMQTPNEMGAVDSDSSISTDEDGNPLPQEDDERMKFDNLKAKFDAYGVAVRAGAITPSDSDEETFRAEAGLPPMTPAVRGAWKEDKGYRRPITLLQKMAQTAGFGPPKTEDPIEE
jgi:hypothetical protein